MADKGTGARPIDMRPCRDLEKLHQAARRRIGFLKMVGAQAVSLQSIPKSTVSGIRRHMLGGVTYRRRYLASSATEMWDAELLVALVAIEAVNLWASFCRSYYLSCMFSARAIGGSKIHARQGATALHDALGLAIRHWRPSANPSADGSWRRRDEPAWHDPDQLLPVCQAQGFSNLDDLRAAFSTGDRTFKDLPVFRNFFATGGSEVKPLLGTLLRTTVFRLRNGLAGCS